MWTNGSAILCLLILLKGGIKLYIFINMAKHINVLKVYIMHILAVKLREWLNFLFNALMTPHEKG